jgi:hypothetical protein
MSTQSAEVVQDEEAPRSKPRSKTSSPLKNPSPLKNTNVDALVSKIKKIEADEQKMHAALAASAIEKGKLLTAIREQCQDGHWEETLKKLGLSQGDGPLVHAGLRIQAFNY